MRVRLPPIKKTQIAADPDAGTESPKGKVNFILETGEHLMTTETKRPLLTPNETDKLSTRAFDEEMKASSASPKKKFSLIGKIKKQHIRRSRKMKITTNWILMMDYSYYRRLLT